MSNSDQHCNVNTASLSSRNGTGRTIDARFVGYTCKNGFRLITPPPAGSVGKTPLMMADCKGYLDGKLDLVRKINGLGGFLERCRMEFRCSVSSSLLLQSGHPCDISALHRSSQ